MKQLTKEEVQKMVNDRRIHGYMSIINRFSYIEKYETPDDIPEVPVVSEYLYKNIIIPGLIRNGAIPKHKLVIGKKYLGSCRNATEAIWTGDEFEYQRYKFGSYYTDTINHFEDDDGYDIFIPIKEL